jgi:diaminopimelate epimerase
MTRCKLDGRVVDNGGMSARFFKYHGLGNDFVVLDLRDGRADIGPEESRALCDRRRGIGADGVLALLPSERAVARMVVHNADGSIAEMCGNGLRCAVKYLLDHAPRKADQLAVETGAGVLDAKVGWRDGEVSEIELSMGQARFLAANLPSSDGEERIDAPVPDAPGFHGTAVSMGNPHLVMFDAPASLAQTLGPKLEHAHGFSQRTNVEFARVSDGRIDVVVWERGCGLTQACGTGACATAAAAVRTGRAGAGEWLTVGLPGGDLRIRVGRDWQVSLKGDARFVYEGVVPIPLAR